MATKRTTHLPGEEGVWLFVLGDMAMFTALFSVFLFYRSLEPAVFATSHRQLSQSFGLINTALMLTSSWCVATAVRAARLERFTEAQRLLHGAMACGLGFGCIKYFEWSAKLHHGITPATDNFFMFYFVLTGIHMVHVVIGTVILLFMARADWRVRAQRASGLRDFESGAVFWHLVDLLWIVLFALLYLVR